MDDWLYQVPSAQWVLFFQGYLGEDVQNHEQLSEGFWVVPLVPTFTDEPRVFSFCVFCFKFKQEVFAHSTQSVLLALKKV